MPSPNRNEKPAISHHRVHQFADRLFGEDMHAARVDALAGAVSGLLKAGQLGNHSIGRGLTAVRGLTDRHATKLVDRLVGNEKLDPVQLSMLVVSLQGSGRAVPLLWTTTEKAHLKGHRNELPDALMERFD